MRGRPAPLQFNNKEKSNSRLLIALVFFYCLPVALINRILIFILSLVFTVLLLIGATTGYAKGKIELCYVCSNEVTTSDHSVSKFIIEYYDLLTLNHISTKQALEACCLNYENL